MAKESALKKLRKSSISVTDIASQFWCEKQMELNYLFGKNNTPAMKRGKEIHEDLQAEVYVPLNIEPVTYADYLYKIGYESAMGLETFKSSGLCREVHIFGSLNGYRISGQIDELKNEGGNVKIIEVKTVMPIKTSSSIDFSNTKSHIVQIMLYKKLIDAIRHREYTFYNFTKAYNVINLKLSEEFSRSLHALGINESYADVASVYKDLFSRFASLPSVSDELEIIYIDRLTGRRIRSITVNYDENAINKDLKFALQYWNGEREALPVPESEKWKCYLCKFYGKQCKVWYDK